MTLSPTEKEKLLSLLKDSSESFSAVVADFSEEAESFYLLPILRDLSIQAKMKLYVKIGGCEAMRDLYDARTLGVDGIIVPMIESVYALEKFSEAADDIFRDSQVERILSIDTKKALELLDDFLSSASSSSLDCILFNLDDIISSSDSYFQNDDSKLTDSIVSSISACTLNGKKTAIEGTFVSQFFKLSEFGTSILSGILLSNSSRDGRPLSTERISAGVLAECLWLTLCSSNIVDAASYLNKRIHSLSFLHNEDLK